MNSSHVLDEYLYEKHRLNAHILLVLQYIHTNACMCESSGGDAKGEVWEAARRVNLPLDQLLRLPDDEVDTRTQRARAHVLCSRSLLRSVHS